MNHRRHFHLRTLLIFCNIYLTSSLVIPTENGNPSTGRQFGRRSLFTAHLALESSSDSREVVSVLPTTLRSQSLPGASSLENKAPLLGGLGRNKIGEDSVPLLSRGGLLGDEQLAEFGASTTSIGEKGKQSDKLNSSWWKNQLPRILKSWWKTVVNHLSSFQKSIKRGFGKIVPSRSYTVLSKSPSSHGISASDRSALDEGTKLLDETPADELTRIPHGTIDDSVTRIHQDSLDNEVTKPHHETAVEQAPKTHIDTPADLATKTPHESTVERATRNPEKSHEPTVEQAPKSPLDPLADQATKTPHEPTVEQATTNPEGSIANQATNIPHAHSHQEDEIFHDALSDFQDDPLDEHESSLNTEPPSDLKEYHAPTEAKAALKEKLSHEEPQVVPKETVPAEEQAASRGGEQALPREKHVPAQAQAVLKETLSPENAQGLPKETFPVEEQAVSKEAQALLKDHHIPTEAQAALQENLSPKGAQFSEKENHSPTVLQAPLEGTHPSKLNPLPTTPDPSLAAPASKPAPVTPDPLLNTLSNKPFSATTESSSTSRVSNPSSAATKSSSAHPEPISTASDREFRPTFRDKVPSVASETAKSTDASLHQTKLAIAELSWKLMQRGEQWDTVFKKLYPGWTFGLSGQAVAPLQGYTNGWKIQYDLLKDKGGVDHLRKYKTLREALDNPSDTAARHGYDKFLNILEKKLQDPRVNVFVNAKAMVKLRDNIASQLGQWEKPRR